MNEFSIQKTSKDFDSGQLYRVSGVLDFQSVPAALPKMLELVKSGESVAVDFANVERANSAAVAMLVEMQVQARKIDCRLEWKNLPASITKIADVCEVGDFLKTS